MIYSYILFLTIYIYHVSEKSSLLITPYNFGDEGVYFKILIGGIKVKTQVLYGKSEIEINVPDDSTIIEPQNIDAIQDYESTIKNVLRNPTNSKPLKEMVNSNDIVSIVISDITRPTPNHILVPLLIEELNHVPRENFVIINGTGTHRDQTRDELIQMLGEDIVNSVKSFTIIAQKKKV